MVTANSGGISIDLGLNLILLVRHLQTQESLTLSPSSLNSELHLKVPVKSWFYSITMYVFPNFSGYCHLLPKMFKTMYFINLGCGWFLFFEYI